MKICITGASGFVGKSLIAKLASFKWSSVVINRSDYGIISTSHVNSSSSLVFRALLNQCWAVIHLAARVHVMHDAATNPLAEFRKVNVHGTLQLARQAAAAGVKRFVFISTAKVNGESTAPGAAFTENDIANPQDPYAQSKYEAEQGLQQIALDTGMEVVIIRPPLVYGPGVKANFAALMRAVQRGWPLPLGAVHNQRSLVGLDNLVDFIMHCITRPEAANQTFLISDGQDVSTTELLRCMTKAAGVPGRLLPIPVPLLRAAGKVIGKTNQIDRLCGNLQIDITKARNVLGWTPPVTLQEGLRRAFVNL